MGKICTKCKVNKKLEDFIKDNRRPNWRWYNCKDCQKHIRAKYTAKNNIKIQQQRKKYREDNKEKIKELWQQYRKQNLEQLIIKQKI